MARTSLIWQSLALVCGLGVSSGIPNAVVVAAKEKAAPIRVRIVAFGEDADAFVTEDLKGRRETAGDLSQALKSREIDVVPPAHAANLWLQIVERSMTVSPNGGALAMPIGGMVVAVPIDEQWRTVTVYAYVGTQTQTFHATGQKTWRSLAKDLAKQIRTWVTDNDGLIRRLSKPMDALFALPPFKK